MVRAVIERVESESDIFKKTFIDDIREIAQISDNSFSSEISDISTDYEPEDELSSEDDELSSVELSDEFEKTLPLDILELPQEEIKSLTFRKKKEFEVACLGSESSGFSSFRGSSASSDSEGSDKISGRNF